MLIYLIKKNMKQYPIGVQLARIRNRYLRANPKPNSPNITAKKISVEHSPAAAKQIKSPHRTLYAVWDFEVCPITFDFLNFLVMSDIEREKRGYEFLQIVIIPGPFDGFRDANTHSMDEKKFRLGSIITPAINLLPSKTKLMLVSHREEGRQILNMVNDEDIFPLNYKIDKPTNHYNWSAVRDCYEAGQNLQRFKADKRSKILIENWVQSSCSNKKILTFSLRESQYESDRNSDLDVIKSFISKLDQSKFAVVIIRDLDLASESFKEWSDIGAIDGQIAIWDIRMRQAMYERADLNFFVNNGPFVMALFSENIAYAVFKMVTESVFVTSHKYFQNNRWEIGKDFLGARKNQKIYWEDESEEGFFKALHDTKLL